MPDTSTSEALLITPEQRQSIITSQIEQVLELVARYME